MLHPKVSPRIRPSLAWILAPAVLIAAAASCDRQATAGLDDAGLQPGFKGKPGGDPIAVDDFNPKEGDQGQRFVMTISGSGFGNGAKVVFALNGDDVSTISTTTTSVDETGENLTADVDIGLDAVVSEDYEVAVSLRGSRGVGTERFRVKMPPGQPVNVPVRLEFEPLVGSAFSSDDGTAAYVDGDRGSDAWINQTTQGEVGLFARVGPLSGDRRFNFQMTIVGDPSPDYPLPTGCQEGSLACAGEASALRTQDDYGVTFLDLTPGNSSRFATFRAGWSEPGYLTWWIFFGDDGGKKPCTVGEGDRVRVTATAFDAGAPTHWAVTSAAGDPSTPNATLCRFKSKGPGIGMNWVADLYGPLEMKVCRLDAPDCSSVP
jgi:hypothetical protein